MISKTLVGFLFRVVFILVLIFGLFVSSTIITFILRYAHLWKEFWSIFLEKSMDEKLKITRRTTGARGYKFNYFITKSNNLTLSCSFLVYLSASQCISVYLGLSETIWTYLGLSGTIWVYLGLYWTILDYLGLSMTILDYLRLSRSISDYIAHWASTWT